MKKNGTLRTRKSQLLALFLFILLIVITSRGTASFLTVITQTASTTTVYLDPPTINATDTDIGQELNVAIMIRDAIDVYSWQAGLLFNNTALNCTGFEWGTFFSDAAGPLGTFPIEGTINNTVGEVTPYGETLLGPEDKASDDGTLICFHFTVIASGVSDLHLRNVIVSERVDTQVNMVAVNIIDVYTVVLDTIPHTVLIESNTTGREREEQNSGFYDHAFNETIEEISFKVDGPYPGFCDVTIPKTLLNVSALDELKVIIDNAPLRSEDITSAQNITHCFVYFMYSADKHKIAITARELLNSNITMTLSSNSVDLGSDVIISGNIDPVRENVTVTIQFRKNTEEAWTTLATTKTDSNSHYSYIWTPQKAGTYQIKVSWAGDVNTNPDESDMQTITVKGAPAGIDPYILAVAAVGGIAIVALVVYFVKVRKPEEE